MTNNTTSCPDPNLTSTAAAAIKAAAYVVIMMLSTLGNLLVILVVIRNQRLRSVALNLFIVSMSMADLLISMFNMTAEIWIHVKYALGQQPVWFDGLLGVILCKAIVFIQGSSMACSVWTLVAIAVNRFFAVFYPLKMGYSKNLSTITICCIWLASCATASPMLYTMKVMEHAGTWQCIEEWTPAFNSHSSKIYTLFLFGFLYILPLAIISVLYSGVVRKVWRRQVPGNVIAPNQQVELVTKKRVLRMLITVVAVFGLCWLPYYAYLLLYFVIFKQPHCGAPANVVFFGFFLGHANAAINPCIYAIFNKEYRNGLLSFHTACLSPIRGSHMTRRPNHSTMKLTQFGTEDTVRQQGGRSPQM